MSNKLLTVLVKFMHPNGRRRDVLSKEQRLAILTHCNGGIPAELTGREREWAMVVYSSGTALKRAYQELVAICPDARRNAVSRNTSQGTTRKPE